MRGVTVMAETSSSLKSISTHTPHARRDSTTIILMHRIRISTHTPHARRDEKFNSVMDKYYISTHTPHARRDTNSET